MSKQLITRTNESKNSIIGWRDGDDVQAENLIAEDFGGEAI